MLGDMGFGSDFFGEIELDGIEHVGLGGDGVREVVTVLVIFAIAEIFTYRS